MTKYNRSARRRVISPMATGNGAFVLHRILEDALPDYRVFPYDPRWTFCPPMLKILPLPRGDIVHTTPDHAVFFRRTGQPLVITLHNYVLDPFMRDHSSILQQLHYRTDLRWFTTRAIEAADVVTAVSQFTADLALRDLNINKPVRVIRNGVDATRFAPRGSRRRQGLVRVLFSGNLTRRKGVGLLPEIAQMLPPGIEICCASGLAAQSDSTNLDRIKMLGHVPYQSMPNLYNDVDILLMPTVREGLSLAVLEAMACGLPVVATRCSSLPEQVHDGRGGYLCVPGDPNDFAQKLIELADSEVLRRSMGDYNRELIEREFSLRTMLDAYRDLFDESFS
ncbi:MAG: glycosyltransferase family 4 protein [Gammaproteobacteria bacterium]|nr:glycosyltransferase family 4 protein [Gammaproteobacteria bacterium]